MQSFFLMQATYIVTRPDSRLLNSNTLASSSCSFCSFPGGEFGPLFFSILTTHTQIHGGNEKKKRNKKKKTENQLKKKTGNQLKKKTGNELKNKN